MSDIKITVQTNIDATSRAMAESAEKIAKETNTIASEAKELAQSASSAATEASSKADNAKTIADSKADADHTHTSHKITDFSSSVRKLCGGTLKLEIVQYLDAPIELSFKYDFVEFYLVSNESGVIGTEVYAFDMFKTEGDIIYFGNNLKKTQIKFGGYVLVRVDYVESVPFVSLIDYFDPLA